MLMTTRRLGVWFWVWVVCCSITQSKKTSSLPRSNLRRAKDGAFFAALFVGVGGAAALTLRPTPASAAASASASASETATATLPEAVASSESFLNGLVSGATSRAAKEVLLHPLDTIKAREQVAVAIASNAGAGADADADADAKENAPLKVTNATISQLGLYDGVTSALLGGVPAGALFFAVKDYSKQQFSAAGCSKEVATLLAVAAANIPYWLIRCPSEVLKTRQQVNLYGTNSRSLTANLFELSKSGQLYSSYSSNLAYSMPSDIVKFLAYEALTSSLLGRTGTSSGKKGEKIGGLEAAAVGAVAGLASQIVTTPLDVARTRIMTATVPGSRKEQEQEQEQSALGALAAIVDKEGIASAFAGLKPRSARALASGAIQFATYELTQNLRHSA